MLRARLPIALTAACVAATATVAITPSGGAGAADYPAAPPVQVSTLVSGLSFPWDLSFTPDGAMLYDERPGRMWVRLADGTNRQLSANFSDLFVGSESGLEGLVVDPAFATNRRFYTCQAYKGAGSSPIDLRVIRWQVDDGYTTATRIGSPVVSGFPISSGRHGGCRLRFALDGTLHVGTGDAAVGTNPQNLQSLGGKTLRVDADGTIPTDNPFYSRGGNARYVYTYGHRNVQGYARRPGNSQLWTVEHGTSRDDEVNLEVRGGNYGWDPVPGYDESTPMTDLTKFPHAVRAKWSSGDPTIAPSGGTFLTGSGWGRWQGALAVGILKDQGVMILTVDPAGTVVRTERIAALQSGYGRIRAAQLGPDDALYLTTSNGSDDKILRVTPNPTAPPAYEPGLDVSPLGVAAALRTDGALGILVRGTDGKPWFRFASGSRYGYRRLPTNEKISAPALVATGGKRFDAFAHGSDGELLHWVYNGNSWSNPQNLYGVLTSAPAAVTLGHGTLYVLARSTDNALWRKSYDGSRWSGWTRVGGTLTSAPGASADAAAKTISVVVRGTNGYAYRTVLSPTATLDGFVRTSATLSSGRAVAATQRTGSDPWAVETSFDGAPLLTRGNFVDAARGLFVGMPAVTQQSGHGPVIVGSGTNHAVYYCNLHGGHCSFVNQGGQVG